MDATADNVISAIRNYENNLGFIRTTTVYTAIGFNLTTDFRLMCDKIVEAFEATEIEYVEGDYITIRIGSNNYKIEVYMNFAVFFKIFVCDITMVLLLLVLIQIYKFIVHLIIYL